MNPYNITNTVFLVLLGTIACSMSDRPMIDPRLLASVNDFETVYSIKLPGFYNKYADLLDAINVIFVDSLPSPMVGVCVDDAPRVIEISKSYWDKADDVDRRILMFHELGHCIFDREHNNALYPDRCKKSLMNEFLPSQVCYLKHEEEMINELPKH